jgi:hypothetical protein
MLRGILRSGGAGRPACTIAVAMLLAVRSAVALAPEVLTSIGAVPPEIAGRFRSHARSNSPRSDSITSSIAADTACTASTRPFGDRRL